MGAEESDLVGRTVDDRYEVIERLGEGGMGAVYRARHVVLDKPVALKLLHRDLAEEPVVLERFRREAKAASAIGHRGIVRVTDFGDLPEGPYLVMELVEGGSLLELLEQRSQLGVRRALRLTAQIAEALAAAHEAGIVHRDLKPANVLIGPEGEARVADFGVAKVIKDDGGTALTRTGDVVGTPQYMSPEQCAGKELDGRTDVYALGLVLFEMLAGQPPFAASSLIQLVNQHVLEPPPRLSIFRRDVSAELDELVDRMLAKDVADRPQSMQDVVRRATALAELEEARVATGPTISPEESLTGLAGPRLGASPEPDDARERVSAVAPTPPPVVSGRRAPWVLYAIAALVAGSLTAGAVVWMLRPAPPEPEVSSDPASTVTLRSEPEAEIVLPGNLLTRTPYALERTMLPAQLVLRAEGYEDLDVTVPANAPLHVFVRLQPVTPEPQPAAAQPEPPAAQPEPETEPEPPRRGTRRRRTAPPSDVEGPAPDEPRPTHSDITDPF